MNNVHLIFDFQFLYYKYKFSLDKGKMKHLTAEVNGENVDISYIYYPLMELEATRKRFAASEDNNVTVSVCFDSKSERKNESDSYKANRGKKLDDLDFDNINEIMELCKTAGYNVYKEVGKEADDLVTSLASKYRDKFDFTVIVTNDSDLAVNVCGNVYMMRYKSSCSDYLKISERNFEDTMGKEFGCRYPFNTVLLFKATVGDTSDGIKGIKGFGVKAFEKYLDYLDAKGVDYRCCRGYNYVKDVLLESEGYLGKDKLVQALGSLELVCAREVDVVEPVKSDSIQTRETAYMKYNMKSLVNE